MKYNVLIVDDSAAIRKILVRVLAQTDLPINDVHEASDGVEALKVLNANAEYGWAPILNDAQGQSELEAAFSHHDHDRRQSGKGP